MRRAGLHILVVLLVLAACGKKKYPPQLVTENEPVFSFKAKINGNDVNITAGIDGYRAFPALVQGTNNVYSLLSELKPNSCNGICPGSLYLSINDYQLSSSGAPVNVQSALASGQRDYIRDLSGHSYTVSFSSSYNKTAASYAWDFGDGSTSTDASPVHVYTQGGKYQVCLRVTGTNGCVSSVCNPVQLTPFNPFNAYINSGQLNTNTLWFQPTVSGGSGSYTFRWAFGDGSSSTISSPTHSYLIKGAYPVRLKVFSPGVDSLTTTYNCVTPGDLSSCAANYGFTLQNNVPNHLALSKVSVQWVHTDGKIYSSLNTSQPSASNFEILSVEDFPGEENGLKLKKVRLRFSCTLYNGTQTLQISNAEATVAMGYK